MITELIPVEESPEEKILKEIDELRQSLDKCRKAQFAQIGSLRKEIIQVKHDHEDWKNSICKAEENMKLDDKIYYRDVICLLEQFMFDSVNELCPKDAKKITLNQAHGFLDKWCLEHFEANDKDR